MPPLRVHGPTPFPLPCFIAALRPPYSDEMHETLSVAARAAGSRWLLPFACRRLHTEADLVAGGGTLNGRQLLRTGPARRRLHEDPHVCGPGSLQTRHHCHNSHSFLRPFSPNTFFSAPSPWKQGKKKL